MGKPMRRYLFLFTLPCLLSLVLLTACSPSSPSIDQSHHKPGVHISKAHYRVDLTYPGLPATYAPLKAKVRQAGHASQMQFVQSLPEPGQLPRLANRQLTLTIHFMLKTDTARFVSVLGTGAADTAGAHPMPITQTFVYDKNKRQLIPLNALFENPGKARQRLSQYARRRLHSKLLRQIPGGREASAKVRQQWVSLMRAMINKGTRPTADNYAHFTVLGSTGGKADGIELVFPPYQVAPYSYGVQVVSVPASVLLEYLKPGYRAAFK